MKKKIIGILVCTLLITTVFPIAGALNINNSKKQCTATDDISGLTSDNNATIGNVNRDWSIVATYPIPEGASGLAYNGAYLYCGIYGANGDEVYQINPSTGSYQLQFTGPQGDAFGLTYDGSYLWTTDHPSTPAVAMQLDMSGNLISQFNLPDQFMSGIAYDNGDFWVATYYPDPATIYKVDATGSVLQQFTAPDNQPWDLCLENANLWMADYWGDTLYKIDPSTGNLLENHASEGVDPAGIVWDGAYLWYCDNGVDYNDDYLYKVALSVEPCEPSVDVEKYVKDKDGNWIDADTESEAVDLKICNDAEFKIVITNTGDCPLVDIIVFDTMHDSLNFTSANPDPDDWWYEEPHYYMMWNISTLDETEVVEILITAHVDGPDSSTDLNHVNVTGECIHGKPVWDEDSCYVHCSEKSREINTPFLNWLQSHPNMFPILQRLLLRLGQK